MGEPVRFGGFQNTSFSVVFRVPRCISRSPLSGLRIAYTECYSNSVKAFVGKGSAVQSSLAKERCGCQSGGFYFFIPFIMPSDISITYQLLGVKYRRSEWQNRPFGGYIHYMLRVKRFQPVNGFAAPAFVNVPRKGMIQLVVSGGNVVEHFLYLDLFLFISVVGA